MAGAFLAGSSCVIKGLQSEAGQKLNGKAAEVMAVDSTSGRICVRLNLSDPQQDWKRLKAENLEPCGGGSAPQAARKRKGVVADAPVADRPRLLVTAAGDNTAKVWDARTGQCVQTLRGHTAFLTCAEFSRTDGGARVVTTCVDKTVKIWDVGSGECRATLEGHAKVTTAASFSPDDGHVVSSSCDKTARIWNVASGQCVGTLEGHTADVSDASFSPDGSLILTGSWDHSARLWNAETRSCLRVLTGHKDWVMSAKFSGDGSQVITASKDGTAKLWSADTGECARTFKKVLLDKYTTTDKMVPAADISPDGAFLISAGGYDGTATLWDVAAGKHVVLDAHGFEGGWKTGGGGVWCVQFSPDGMWVVTSSEDQTAMLWDRRTGKVALTFEGHTGPVRWASFAV